jgi:hypothetical protein
MSIKMEISKEATGGLLCVMLDFARRSSIIKIETNALLGMIFIVVLKRSI